MPRMSLVVLISAIMLTAGCGERSSAPASPKTEAKPAAAPTAPAPPPAPAVPAVPPEAVKTAPPAAAPPAKPAAATPVEAAKPPKVADVIVLEASQGKVSMHHLEHARKFPCATCHGEAAPGKIALDKETAHALCRDCHQAKGVGPTACPGCHKK